MKKNKQFLVITGEKSGELLAVDVIKELKKIGSFEFIGTGSELLKKEGVTLIEFIDKMAVVGIVEVFKAYGFLKKLMRKILDIIKEQKIDYVLLVDYPGFNLRLAKEIKKINKHINVFYLVSPQIWAWNYKRIQIIKKNVDFMFVLFPFEKEIYEKENIPCEWIGHPMRFRIQKEIRKQIPIKVKGKPIIGILPGSRFSEVSRLLIPMLEGAELIQKKYPKAEFLVPVLSSDKNLYNFVNEICMQKKNLKLRIVPDASLRVMKESDLLILASGTATLEASYFKKPMIICYKVNYLSYFIFGFLIKTKFIGLPNLLSKEQVALELLQNEVNPKFIFNEAMKILQDENYKKRILKSLSKIQFAPKNQNPAKTTAEIIKTLIRRKKYEAST
ncbi:MAG: lipid-A-disaccharide synthase [Leptonema sp. (in: bacteria)]